MEIEHLSKELGMKEAAYLRDEKEKENMQNQLAHIGDLLERELGKIRHANDRERKEYQSAINEIETKLHHLNAKGKSTEDELHYNRKKYNELMERLHCGLNGTLNTAFDDFHGPVRGNRDSYNRDHDKDHSLGKHANNHHRRDEDSPTYQRDKQRGLHYEPYQSSKHRLNTDSNKKDNRRY